MAASLRHVRRLAALALVLQLAPPAPRPAAARGAPAVPVVPAVIGDGVLFRSGPRADERRPGVTVYRGVEVQIHSQRPPRAGGRATVVPVHDGLKPFELALRGTHRDEGCDGEVVWTWELEPVGRPDLAELAAPAGRRPEVPFDVVVLYPAVAGAFAVPRARLSPERLPRGVFAAQVKAAVGWSEPDAPDAVIVERCCGASPGDAAARPGECAHTCGETYLRRAGRWTIVDRRTPC